LAAAFYLVAHKFVVTVNCSEVLINCVCFSALRRYNAIIMPSLYVLHQPHGFCHRRPCVAGLYLRVRCTQNWEIILTIYPGEVDSSVINRINGELMTHSPRWKINDEDRVMHVVQNDLRVLATYCWTGLCGDTELREDKKRWG